MGYTHYWKQSRSFNDIEWEQITKAAKVIIAKATKGSSFKTAGEPWRIFEHPEIPNPQSGVKIALAGPLGTGKPEITDKYIALNGSEAINEDYETFRLERGPQEFSFCKTEFRPYDPVVVSILAIAHEIAPDAIEPTSDGGPEAIKNLFAVAV